jgi:ElaB/YqjD/DUF883 family membrane-anchored ribosome-binding protein
MHAGAAREKLVSDLKVLIDDVEDLVKATADQAGDSLSSLRQRLMQRLDEGRETLSEQQKVVGDVTRQATRGAVDYAQHNPWNVVGIALGIGLIIGLILWSQEEY